jgi:hypothetical protein
MNEIEIIKKQLKTLQDLRYGNNPLVSEHIKEIKEKYLIKENDDSPRDIKRYDVPKAVDDEIVDDIEDALPNDKSQAYRISGGVLIIHADEKKDTDLTTEEKLVFQQTMDDFVSGVSDLVNFEPLNIYKDNVDWSGKVVDFDTDFYFTIGENNGIYITNEMTKIDENYLDFIEKLKTYYEKFKSKWAPVIASRKKTKIK